MASETFWNNKRLLSWSMCCSNVKQNASAISDMNVLEVEWNKVNQWMNGLLKKKEVTSIPFWNFERFKKQRIEFKFCPQISDFGKEWSQVHLPRYVIYRAKKNEKPNWSCTELNFKMQKWSNMPPWYCFTLSDTDPANAPFWYFSLVLNLTSESSHTASDLCVWLCRLHWH